MAATTAQEDRFRRFVLNNKDIGFDRMLQIVREEQERGSRKATSNPLNPYSLGLELFDTATRLLKDRKEKSKKEWTVESAWVQGSNEPDPKPGMVKFDLLALGTVTTPEPSPPIDWSTLISYEIGDRVTVKTSAVHHAPGGPKPTDSDCGPYTIIGWKYHNGRRLYCIQGKIVYGYGLNPETFKPEEMYRPQGTKWVSVDDIVRPFQYSHQPCLHWRAGTPIYVVKENGTWPAEIVTVKTDGTYSVTYGGSEHIVRQEEMQYRPPEDQTQFQGWPIGTPVFYIMSSGGTKRCVIRRSEYPRYLLAEVDENAKMTGRSAWASQKQTRSREASPPKEC